MWNNANNTRIAVVTSSLRVENTSQVADIGEAEGPSFVPIESDRGVPGWSVATYMTRYADFFDDFLPCFRTALTYLCLTVRTFVAILIPVCGHGYERFWKDGALAR